MFVAGGPPPVPFGVFVATGPPLVPFGVLVGFGVVVASGPPPLPFGVLVGAGFPIWPAGVFVGWGIGVSVEGGAVFVGCGVPVDGAGVRVGDPPGAGVEVDFGPAVPATVAAPAMVATGDDAGGVGEAAACSAAGAVPGSWLPVDVVKIGTKRAFPFVAAGGLSSRLTLKITLGPMGAISLAPASP